eukprot:267504-Amphidinium_carterae.1
MLNTACNTDARMTKSLPKQQTQSRRCYPCRRIGSTAASPGQSSHIVFMQELRNRPLEHRKPAWLGVRQSSFDVAHVPALLCTAHCRSDSKGTVGARPFRALALSCNCFVCGWSASLSACTLADVQEKACFGYRHGGTIGLKWWAMHNCKTDTMGSVQNGVHPQRFKAQSYDE